MNEYEIFQQYFKNLGASITGIESVVFVSNWEEIMELQLDKANYPALVVETPDIDVKNNGGFHFTFDSAFAVVKGTPKDEKLDYYETVKAEMLVVFLEVMGKIMCDDDVTSTIDAEIESQVNPIIKATADNCYGWRTYFKISNITLS